MLTKIFGKDLRFHHEALRSAALLSLPYLEELKLTIIVQSDGGVTWPVMAGLIAGGYIIPAFASIAALRLVIGWKATRNVKKYYPAGQFLLEQLRDAFAHLDSLLMDETLFRSLKEVEIDFGPTFAGKRKVEDGVAWDLQTRIRSEAMEVFHRTIERLDTFSVTATSGCPSANLVPAWTPPYSLKKEGVNPD
jgi:hypothetical protein